LHGSLGHSATLGAEASRGLASDQRALTRSLWIDQDDEFVIEEDNIEEQQPPMDEGNDDEVQQEDEKRKMKLIA
jgi:hypothetical protein